MNHSEQKQRLVSIEDWFAARPWLDVEAAVRKVERLRRLRALCGACCRLVSRLKLGVALLVVTVALPAARGAPISPVVRWLDAAVFAWAPRLEAEPVRRGSIVSAAWEAAQVEPSLFPGRDGRARTAAFVLAVWRAESGGFDARVVQHCAGLPASYCDRGRAWCYGQIRLDYSAYLLPAAWTGPALDADPVKCARATIRVLAAKAAVCSVAVAVGGDRFAGYTGDRRCRSVRMRKRFDAAAAWWTANPAPVTP